MLVFGSCVHNKRVPWFLVQTYKWVVIYRPNQEYQDLDLQMLTKPTSIRWFFKNFCFFLSFLRCFRIKFLLFNFPLSFTAASSGLIFGASVGALGKRSWPRASCQGSILSQLKLCYGQRSLFKGTNYQPMLQLRLTTNLSYAMVSEAYSKVLTTIHN